MDKEVKSWQAMKMIIQSRIIFQPRGTEDFGHCADWRRHWGAKDPFHQMINNDGTCVGDLMVFLEENSGAIKAVYEWVEENYENELAEMSGEDEDPDADEEGEEID